MISLNDNELQIVMRAAAPLPPASRSLFLEAVARELAALPRDEVGEGSISRITRAILHDCATAPDVTDVRCPPKFSRANWR